MRNRTRKSFHHFNVIVHIKASSSDIILIFGGLGFFLVLPFGGLFSRIKVLSVRLILSVVPGDVSVSIVGVHGVGRDHTFRVIHC